MIFIKLRTLLFSLIISLCTCFDMYSQNDQNSSGLFFSSHEVILDKRTSLSLTPDHPFNFKKKFSIQFDARFRRGDGYYGSICRIIGNGNTNIDLISNLASETANFSLVVTDTITYSYKLQEIPNSDFGKWIKVKMEFDLKNSTVSVSFNGVLKKKRVSGVSNLNNFDIVFGACSNPKFLNSDVSPMTLNNVVITDNNNNIYRHWKLTRHATNEVYDEIKGEKALVKNGTWLIDKHIKWEKEQSVKIQHLVGAAKNEVDGLIYFIGRDNMLIYSISDNSFDTITYSLGCPFKNYYNYYVYNRKTNKIISYDFKENKLNEFDIQTRTWGQSKFDYKEPDLAHHNKVISPIDGRLITFGGYGHYTYKGIIKTFSPTDTVWKTKDVSNEIFPRYLSAAGISNNEWLIFGGYGSKSGRQEVSPEFYYDLYSYNIKTNNVKKVLQYKAPEIPFVPCEALIKRPGVNSFYTLLYNPNNFKTYLRLAEFNLSEPKYVIYSDSIPYDFSDIESWCTFFLDQKSSTLIAITLHNDDAAIFSLAYPALMSDDVIQSTKVFKTWIVWLFIFLIIIVLVALSVLFLRKKKQVLKSVINNYVSLFDNQSFVSIDIPKRKSKSSIYFLGGFQVFDKEGEDISVAFTPTLKQLFIIILLNTVRNGRGISSNKLNELLWFDKSDNSARNNRNVSISKLRTILDKVGDIDIDQESSYWRVKTTGVYSDYIELTSMSEKFRQQNSSLTDDEVLHFVQVAFRGELLPDFQIDWLDEFKADFSNLVLDTLSKFTTQSDVRKNLPLLNHIAECILKFDTTNEEAIVLKCTTLYRLGKKGLAKTAYDSFVREYHNLLGAKYPVTFNDMIDMKS